MTIVASIGTRSTENFTIANVSGTSPGPYTVTLDAVVAAPIVPGDIVISGGNTFLITAKGSTTLTVIKAYYGSASDPATGAATSTRAHSTMQSWEDALPSTLTEAVQGEMWNDSEFTGTLVIAGITTTASFTITLTTGPGQSFNDHVNKATNPIIYDQSKGVGCKSTNGTDHVSVQVRWVTIKYIQWFKDLGTGYAPIVLNQASDTVAQDNVFFGNIWQRNNGATGGRFINCKCSDFINNAVIQQGTNRSNIVVRSGGGFGVARVINNTIVGKSNGSVAPFTVEYGSTAILANNAIYGYDTAIGGTWDGTNSKNNSTDSATCPGTSNLVSQTFADQFENTSTDFRVKTGAGLINAGVADALTNGVDIINRTRNGSTPTIGAWEFIAAGGGGVPKSNKLLMLGVG